MCTDRLLFVLGVEAYNFIVQFITSTSNFFFKKTLCIEPFLICSTWLQSRLKARNSGGARRKDLGWPAAAIKIN